MTTNKLPEWRKALNKSVENYQSAQAWYEENQDSPSAEQDVDTAAGEIEKLLKQYGVLIVLSLLDEIAELQERRKADSAEPVAWRYRTTDINGNPRQGWSFSEEASLMGLYQPLYATPPAPVVPEGLLSAMEEVLRISDRDHEAWHKVRSGITSCRDVMLQAGNSPVTPDGLLDCGENCWSCGKYFTYEQHSECDGYCPHCNSPVDLDDEEEQPSKVVPTNPTEEMISNAWREGIGKCDHETIKRIYAAMLVSAPTL